MASEFDSDGPFRNTAARRRWPVLTGAFALMVTLFILDLQTPLGLAIWLPYLFVILLCLSVPGRRPTYLAAAGCSILTIIGIFYPPPPGPMLLSIINRSLAVVTFWLTAFGGLTLRRTAALQATNEKLRAEIEERRRAEERVREQASLLDIAHDAISVRDLDERILYWNRGAERMYGWSAAEVIGRRADELFIRSPDDVAAAARILLHRGEWSGEVRHTSKDGRELLVESRWTLVKDENGKPKAKLVVNTDVTEKRSLERRILGAQRLESIGVLAGGIAHDFNNLLTPMLMGVKLLREDRPPEERSGLLATLQAGAERGAELVRKLLSFAGGGGNEKEPVNLARIVREVEGIIEHTFPKSISLSIRLPQDLPPLLADATQLSQVLMNLCVNARDAMPGGGSLSIDASNMFVDPELAASYPDAQPGCYVRFTVADTGHGIPSEILDRIFDPFFTTKTSGHGTGLGLSTVLGIVRSHGGFLTVNSVPKHGSEFAVHWPIAEFDAPISIPAPSIRQAPQPTRSSGIVLVIDDEQPILEAAKATLEGAGYRVETARDGRSALDRFRSFENEVSAIVLDVMMPGLDGEATLNELRKRNGHRRVLLTSGLRLPPSLAETARELGVGFLPKPYTSDQLIAALEPFHSQTQRAVHV